MGSSPPNAGFILTALTWFPVSNLLVFPIIIVVALARIILATPRSKRNRNLPHPPRRMRPLCQLEMNSALTYPLESSSVLRARACLRVEARAAIAPPAPLSLKMTMMKTSTLRTENQRGTKTGDHTSIRCLLRKGIHLVLRLLAPLWLGTLSVKSRWVLGQAWTRSLSIPAGLLPGVVRR